MTRNHVKASWADPRGGAGMALAAALCIALAGPAAGNGAEEGCACSMTQ